MCHLFSSYRKDVGPANKGLSIGGRVTQRDAMNKALITGVELTEISLVDRPANPEALIDAYKAAGAEGLGKLGARNSAADLERIQSVHDTAVALGANCAGHPDDEDDDADDDGDNQDDDADQDDNADQDDDDTGAAI